MCSEGTCIYVDVAQESKCDKEEREADAEEEAELDGWLFVWVYTGVYVY